MAAKAVVDWTRVSTKLGLQRETVSALNAFRKRNDDARRVNNNLKAAKSDVDFEHYRKVLSNKDVVAQGEKLLREFKPVEYDVSAQLKAIDAFQAKAVEAAEATTKKIDEELADLQKTLKNIEDARPFEDLSVYEVTAARPEIAKTTDALVSNGKFTVPGYHEKFGNLSAI